MVIVLYHQRRGNRTIWHNHDNCDAAPLILLIYILTCLSDHIIGLYYSRFSSSVVRHVHGSFRICD